MKIYNIRNVKEFSRKLAACEGNVEIISENGLHLQIHSKDGTADLIPFYYVSGEIKEMELIFEKDEDCHKIFSYLLNFKKTPA